MNKKADAKSQKSRPKPDAAASAETDINAKKGKRVKFSAKKSFIPLRMKEAAKVPQETVPRNGPSKRPQYVSVSPSCCSSSSSSDSECDFIDDEKREQQTNKERASGTKQEDLTLLDYFGTSDWHFSASTSSKDGEFTALKRNGCYERDCESRSKKNHTGTEANGGCSKRSTLNPDTVRTPKVSSKPGHSRMSVVRTISMTFSDENHLAEDKLKSPVIFDWINVDPYQIQVKDSKNFSSVPRLRHSRSVCEFENFWRTEALTSFLTSHDGTSFADVTVVVEEHAFQTYSFMLVMFSQYFRDLNDKGLLEPHCKIELKGISASAFQNIINWMKTGKLNLMPDNAHQLLQAAQVLGLFPLVALIEGYIIVLRESKGDPVPVQEFAIRFGLTDEAKRLSSVSSSFPKCIRTRLLLDYTVDQLCVLLTNDDLVIDSEMEVYEAACRWLLHTPENAEQEEKVLRCVRFSLMTPVELCSIATDLRNPVNRSPFVQNALTNALLHHLLKTEGSLEKFGITPPKPRSHMRSRGHGETQTVEAEHRGDTVPREPSNSSHGTSYSPPNMDTWALTVERSKSKTMEVPSESLEKPYSPPSVDDAIWSIKQRKPQLLSDILPRNPFMVYYVELETESSGKPPSSDSTNSLPPVVENTMAHNNKQSTYELPKCSANTSQELQSENSPNSKQMTLVPISKAFVVIPNTFLCLVLGGTIVENTCLCPEKLNSRIYGLDAFCEFWHYSGRLPLEVTDAAACMVERCVYLTGGSVSLDVSPTPLSWKLDTRSGQWALIAPMCAKRCQHALVHCSDGKLYAIGGCDSDRRPMNVLESYNPRDNSWTVEPPLPVPRYGAAVASYQNNICVCGGVIGFADENIQLLTDRVDVYRSDQRKWIRCTPFPAPRAFCDLICINDRLLIVVGGLKQDKDGEIRVSSEMLVLDLYENEWKHLADLRCARFGIRSIYKDPCLMLVGGSNQLSGPPLPIVECFDMNSKKWINAPHLPLPMTGACCVPIDQALPLCQFNEEEI